MKKFLRHLYFQVLIAIAIGVFLGVFLPEFAVQLKPLGEGFIDLIKMLIAPVIFCTVVTGIARSGNMKKAGRVGLKAILYFEVVSTFALALGLIVVNVLKPGSYFHVEPSTLDASAVELYAQKAQQASTTEFIRHIIPKTFTEAFTGNGDLLQVLLVALLFGCALNLIGEKGHVVHQFIQSMSQVFFKMVDLVMKLAPIGALGSMAFTIGKFGIKSFGPLLYLMGAFYLTCILFVVFILGGIARLSGFSIFKFIKYIKEELLIVLGTSSSESALAPLMEKLERIGCSKSVVGLVVPAGYSFNLDGTNIYLTMAAVFIAQALGINLSIAEQLSLLAVAIITSKGASGVTGAGFITLAATLAVVPSVPVAGLALILGIDRFMSEARALTNIIGNGVATVVISRWEKELDPEKLKELT